MKSTILVPIDGSENSLRALDVAIELARAMKANLELCAVVDTARMAKLTFGEPQLEGGAYDALNGEAEMDLKTAVARLMARGIEKPDTLVACGDPATEIELQADRCGASMIVMGTHGRTGLQHLVMGSVAEGVMRRATVPVVVVPPQRDRKERAPRVRPRRIREISSLSASRTEEQHSPT